MSVQESTLLLAWVARFGRAARPRYDGNLSAESWKMHYIGLGHRLERIPRFAPGCQAAYDDKCLKSPFS